MAQLNTTKTVYTVAQFLEWQRAGSLQLKPVFQRREVWPAKLKSLLIDTVVSGLPIPIIFLRQLQDVETLTTVMEVVDGQQRLRTFLSFIDPSSLEDYDPGKDSFMVQESHNPDIAGKTFRELTKTVRADILGYEISTHVFPPTTDDRDILRIFGRLNSTGAKLNAQELRNATYYGEFKTLSYELALESLDRWRRWRVFSDQDIARMIEVESVSDFLLAMMRGIEAKSKARLDKAYKDHDDKLKGARRLRARFRNVMDAIDNSVGHILPYTRLRRQALFYSLYTACYDHMYKLTRPYTRPSRAKPLPSSLRRSLGQLSKDIVDKTLPDEVQDAMDRATADRARRVTRHRHFKRALRLG